MSGSGKGKEKEVVGEPVSERPGDAASDPLSYVPKSDAAVAPRAEASSSSAPAETSAASLDPTVDLSAPTPQTELPSETTEGPAASAQQINPHVSVVSISTFLSRESTAQQFVLIQSLRRDSNIHRTTTQMTRIQR